MKLFRKILMLILAATIFSSCEDFFNKTSDNMLSGGDNYEDKSNIYASFMGLFATLQDVADDMIIVSELRGDLMTPTNQAPDKYWEVFKYTAKEDNPIIDPASLYKIVMNCNDFLRNTVAYNKNYPGVLTHKIYREMISGAITLRAWAYLAIGKLYGEAVYYDYAMTGEVDLSKLPLMQFDELVSELIYFMDTGVDKINAFVRVDMDLMFGVAGTVWRRMAITPDMLMCELYLWDKNYQAAAKLGVNIITGVGLLDAGGEHNMTMSYQFGNNNTGIKPWHTIFTEDPVQVQTNEGLTMAVYSYTQQQTHQLQNLFSATPPNLYHLKPTQNMINKLTGEDYRVTSGGVVSNMADPRGVGITYGTEFGESVIYKYHCKDREFYKHDATIYLYRAAELHLMIAEALNALGNYDAADYILNVGFSAAWISGRNYTYPFDAPIYSYGKLKLGRGVRGRLDIPPLLSTSKRFMGDLDPATESERYNERRKFVLDSLIVEETARELAYEGKRWFATVRMARNNNDPEFLSDLISRKFSAAERPPYKELLRDPNSWFIRYDLKLDRSK